MDIDQLLKYAVEKGASDLHIQAAAPPAIRISGVIHSIENEPPLEIQNIEQFLAGSALEEHREDIYSAARNGLDYSYEIADVARFRCSAYSTMGRLGVVFRVIRTQIPSIESLHLPSVVRDIALSMRGLVLLTGTTGSGKSTTLAAMIDLINANHALKIFTVEDPIEFIHPPKKAMIAQLELGGDTVSFDQALRQALRQDPDVILVGELRDTETLRMALRAADTGHQVFATVHSSRAAQTIERIIAMFPPAEHKILLSQLAHSVEAIISQRLVPTRDGKRRPAVEILRGGPVAEKFIMESKLTELNGFLESGQSSMQSFDQHLVQMHREGLISGTEALANATRPEALAVALRGIKQTARTMG
jgi:twitching motility protein PilT